MNYGLVSAVVALSLLFGASQILANDKGADDAIKKARAVVTKDLKDPSSTQFRKEVAYPTPKDLNVYVVCGEINAKNSFGGYVGFTKYYVLGDHASIRNDPNWYKSFDGLWEPLCSAHMKQ